MGIQSLYVENSVRKYGEITTNKDRVDAQGHHMPTSVKIPTWVRRRSYHSIGYSVCHEGCQENAYSVTAVYTKYCDSE